MSIRPIPAGQESSFTWGPLGKRKKYINQAFKSVPNLTTDEKREMLMNKMKPYNSEDYLGKEIFVVGGGEPTTTSPAVSQTQTPTPTPTPTITSTQTPTPTPTITSTQTPTPTGTPTPTASSTPLSALEYVIYAENTTNTSSYTFSNVNYNGPGLIIVGIHATASNTGSLGTPSISGFNMTEVVRTSATSGVPQKSITALYSYRMTGGTSANIIVPFNDTMSNCAISVWRLTNNVSDTAYATDVFNNIGSTTAADVDLNLNTGRNHLVIIQTIRDTDTFTWTNATEQYDNQIGAETARATGARGFYIGSGIANISTSFGSAALPTMVGATFN